MSEQLTLIEEAFGLTVVEGENLQLTLDGGNGPAGPNTVTTSTSTTLTGYIFGNGTTIAGATAAVSAATANTLVLRTGTGAASLAGLTNTGTLNLATGTTFTYGTGIAATHRTALGLGTLATQNGTFSGTSSGTNTGDQDLSGYLPDLSSMEATGLGSSGLFGDALVEDSTLTFGKRSWTGALSELYYTSTAWNFAYNDGANSYQATKVSSSDEPWTLGSWTTIVGTGDPSFLVFPSALQPINNIGTIALTSRMDGQPDKLTGGTISGATAFASGATFTYSGTSASDHRIALGAGTTGATLFGAADAAAARTTLGLATTDSVTFTGITATGTLSVTGDSTLKAWTVGSNITANVPGGSLQVSGIGALQFGGAGERIYNSGSAIKIRNAANTLDAALTCSNLTASGTVKTGGYTFATLPTPTTGMRAYITDGALAPIYLTNAAGGGSVVTPVFYNGTNWINA